MLNKGGDPPQEIRVTEDECIEQEKRGEIILAHNFYELCRSIDTRKT